MTTCCWVGFSYPNTLVNIGMEAVAMLSDNVICFTDLKTKQKLYYKPDNPVHGYGATNLVGHYRFPIFAFSETVMRPSIHVMRYPEMVKIFVFSCTDVVNYVDLIFSDYDHLIALSGYPHYKLRVWNCRTGHFLVEIVTNWKCSPLSLLCSCKNVPLIVQYSKWHKDVTFWELQFAPEKTHVHEISKVVLGRDYTVSQQFAICFSDDGGLYVVNDYGTVSSVNVAQFHLKREWATHYESYEKPRQYRLYHHKQGLMVANKEKVIFIKKTRGLWSVQWVLKVPQHGIEQMVTNFNGEVYAANHVGNLYQLQVNEYDVELIALDETHVLVIDYVILRGTKEENLLMLTQTSSLRAVDINRFITYSTLTVENASCIGAHNSLAFVAVGTATGQVHFILYEKIRAPVVLSVLDVHSACIRGVRLVDHFALVRCAKNSFHGIVANVKQNEFLLAASSENYPDVRVLDFYLIDETVGLVFCTDDLKGVMPSANVMWCSHWLHRQRAVERKEFALPKAYRCVNLIHVTNKDAIEICALPMHDFIIDILILRNKEQLILTTTIWTNHIGCINGIIGTRNIVTWGVSSMHIHFRSHKRAAKPFMISRCMHVHYSPRIVAKCEEVYNSKYLIALYSYGGMFAFKLPLLSDNVKENVDVSVETEPIEPQRVLLNRALQSLSFAVKVITPAEIAARTYVIEQIKNLEEEVRALIDYDISVTGKTKGIYRKFCLNYVWLDMLNQQARILCDIERKSLMDSINDQERIRSWILGLVTNFTLRIGVKIRSIFTNIFFENYSERKEIIRFNRLYDIYRFYDMERPREEEHEEPVQHQGDEDEEEVADAPVPPKKEYSLWKVEGPSVYEHIMREELRVQDKNSVTSNQMANDNVKFKIVINDPLKKEFNKMFMQVQTFKQEIIDSILSTNATLTKIHDNMNIMLRLLHMDTFVPEPLSVPQWSSDEVLERIMTVDDSEIKAINRRRKKAVVTDQKHGRMLLWSVDFWVRALNTMMDGVLEKLWEEEIKKTPPEPEFVSKKHPHDYTLEEQKLLRLYEDTLNALREDRRKYLRILRENELKTIDLKKRFILKFNEKCAEMAITKLKYDYAMRHLRVRLLSTKISQFQRMQWRKRLHRLREDVAKVGEYISQYGKLIDFCERSVSDIKERLENLAQRNLALDRTFKGQFLAFIPAHSAHELAKLYRRRPKMQQRSFNSSLVCYEVAARVAQKVTRNIFPLAVEVNEYFNQLTALDNVQQAPAQLDPKYWDAFTKIRRQKIEIELKIKGYGHQLSGAQMALNSFITDLSNLKNCKLAFSSEMERTADQYFDSVQNQKLQITLPMGHVEVSVAGRMTNLSTCLLMNLDDVNGINDMIKEAGAKKLRTMTRLAVFRRQVIYKEWEHKMFRANIQYLKYMLQVVEKCKVTMEFLDILRNWSRAREKKTFYLGAGVIERAIEQKITGFRKNLDRIVEKIEEVRQEIAAMKHKNQLINHQIDEVKVSVAMSTANRDVLMEERRLREQKERMQNIKRRSQLIDTVRRDYAHILELKTILELQRLRTYPTLGQAPNDCPEPDIYRP